MKPELKRQLNTFDALTVVMIAVGVVIVTLTLFMSLSLDEQKKITSSLDIFDIHEQFQDSWKAPAFVFETSQIYMDEFYSAFSEAAVIDRNRFALVENLIQKTLAYSDTVAVDYNRSMKQQEQGKVAGISISIDTDSSCNLSEAGFFCRLNMITNSLTGPEIKNEPSPTIEEHRSCDLRTQGFMCRLILLMEP